MGCRIFAHCPILVLGANSFDRYAKLVASLRGPQLKPQCPGRHLGLFPAWTFPMAPSDPSHRYSVRVSRVGDRDHWIWEIQRTPPLGVRLYGENFHSARAAKVDGEKALQNLLKSVANEKPDT